MLITERQLIWRSFLGMLTYTLGYRLNTNPPFYERSRSK